MTTKIQLSAPVYFAAGESLNGVTMESSQWILSGTALVADEKALMLERDGLADVLEVDGKRAVWGACCDGKHDHS